MEVEIKALFKSSIEYGEAIKKTKRLEGLEPTGGQIEKNDMYFSKYGSMEESFKNKEKTIRLRDEVDESGKHTYFFTTKEKHVSEDGRERNIEVEKEIQNLEKKKNELFSDGYRVVFNKYKRSRPFTKQVMIDNEVFIFTIEIEQVGTFYFAIEIECITEKKNYIQKVFEEEVRILKEDFGIALERIEKRSWYEILK